MIINLYKENDVTFTLHSVEGITHTSSGDIKVYFKSGHTLWIEKEEYDFYGMYEDDY